MTTTGGRPWAGAVLFDWDGTLVDSRQALLAAWHDVTSRVLGRAWPVEEDDIGVVLSRRGTEVFPSLSDDPAVVQALADAFTPAYERHAAEGVRPFPGAVDLLEELNGRAVAVGVVTSKARARYTADAVRGRMNHLIAAATCAEDVIRGKPDPQAALSVLEQLGVPADRAVMVGDTVVDIRTGRAAGIRSIGVTWGSTPAGPLVEAGADAVVETFDELRAALSTGPLAP
ncbi:HAD family hydrolase [Blastococcus montanus]|uniref:HAD family hydrolase n=1 Tax=Blastococcus montanus TaxID=3144973 RepID=UPI00320AAC47